MDVANMGVLSRSETKNFCPHEDENNSVKLV